MRKKRKARTTDDPAHLAKVRKLGCIVCRNTGHRALAEHWGDWVAKAALSIIEAHHIKDGYGTLKAPDRETFPLCRLHHREGKRGVALHAGIESFEANFGAERELLARTLEMLKR